MPAILKAMTCKSCGQLHDFYIAGDAVVADHRYTYTCPTTQEKETMVPWTAPTVADATPPGAVELMPAQP